MQGRQPKNKRTKSSRESGGAQPERRDRKSEKQPCRRPEEQPCRRPEKQSGRKSEKQPGRGLEEPQGRNCPGGARLNKVLSEAGVCSRREADRLIEAGRVLVDGRPAAVGERILPAQSVLLDGHPLRGKSHPVLLAVNKPRGIVCTTSGKDRAENIVEFLDYPERIYPVGRLDKDSEGLILMTNQGEIADKILRGRNGHEKEYIVTVDAPVTEVFLKRMSRGVEILDTVTRPCKVEQTGEKEFRIVLTQGLNRQIRRMCEALGCRVKTLKRIRIMNINLGNLKTGEYRKVTGKEWEGLLALLNGSEQRR